MMELPPIDGYITIKQYFNWNGKYLSYDGRNIVDHVLHKEM